MNDDKPAPLFNSSMDYLVRINTLITMIHEQTMTGKLEEAQITLERLELELDPRMNEKERQELEKISKRARGNPKPGIQKEYFKQLNRFAHKNGLIMKDEQEGPGALKRG